MENGNRILNAVIGAIVNVVSSFVIGPLGPILGGIVAGYLQRQNGLGIGGLSGAIAAIPSSLAIFAFGSLLFFIPDVAAAGVGVLLFVVIVLIVFLIDVVLGAVGGYLGVRIAMDVES
jgi:hypothetical protein